MPSSKPCFRVVLDTNAQKNLNDEHVKPEKARLARDSNVRLTADVLEFDYPYDHFEALYPNVRKAASFSNRASWHSTYATPEYQKEMAEKLDNARDGWRDFKYPNQQDPGLGGGKDAQAGTKQVLQNGPGMVLANEHTDQHTKDMMVTAMDTEDIGLLFIEEFQVSLQPFIDAFLDSPSDEFPPELKKKIDVYKTTWEVDFGPLLLKAKQKGARIYGIDSAEAHYVASDDPLHHENRCAVMNQVSADVMKDAIRKNPGKKFVAMCGSAHATTHAGGIPGLAEIVNVPSVKVAVDGKMTYNPEDANNRMMPAKECHQFADKFARQAVKAYSDVQRGGNDKDETIDQNEVIAEATKLAKNLQQAGRLRTVKDIDALLSAADVLKVQNDLIARTQARRDVRKELKQFVDNGDRAGLSGRLDRLQREDAYGYVNDYEKNGTTLLHYAAEKGQVNCIEEMANRGVGLDLYDKGSFSLGKTPLHIAAEAGHAAATEKLLNVGANPNLRTKKKPKHTALHLAASKPGDCVKKLLQGGAIATVHNGDGKTPLHVAAESGQATATKDLINGGAILDASDPDGNTAVHLAAKSGAQAVLGELITGRASLNTANHEGNTALHLAAQHGQTPTLKQLVGANGIRLEELDQSGGTAMHLAAEYGFSDAVDELADAGASTVARDAKGNLPLHRACGGKSADAGKVVENLLDRHTTDGTSINTTNTAGESAMHCAGRAGNLKIVSDLTDRFADAKLTDKSGATALEAAVVERFRVEAHQKYDPTQGDGTALEEREITAEATRVAKKMIKEKAITAMQQVDQLPTVKAFSDEVAKLVERTKNRAKEYAKAKSAIEGNKDADLTQLLNADPGLKYYVEPKEQQSLLHLAARRSDATCIDVLATNGADLNAKDKAGNTPVMCTVMHRRKDQFKTEQAAALKLLLDKGADFDAQNQDGKTAMHYTAWNGNTAACKHLLTKGADATKTDSRGWTAYQTVLGSTKPETEQAFYDHDPSLQTELVKKGQHSTIDILMQATTCENPEHVEKVRKSFETLYANDMVRPILDLVALDAAGKRQPPKGGTRIFIADTDHTGELWNAAGKGLSGARGAYDDSANVVMVGAKKSESKGLNNTQFWEAKTGDFAGCLVHEMTHLAAHIVYGDKVEPFQPGQASETAYKKAITDDMKKCHALCNSSTVEKGVKDRMIGRMDHYVNKPNAEHELMMEYIVNIPQIAAEFGPDAARKYMPEMTKYFEDFTQQCDTVAKSQKFATARQRVDGAKNKQLATTLAQQYPPPNSEEQWVKSEDTTAADILDMVKSEFVAKHGVAKPPTGVSVPFKVEHFDLKDPEQNQLKLELDKKLVAVKKTLDKTIGASGLPPKMSSDDLRTFVTATATMVETTSDKDIEKALAKKTDTFLREAKIRYVDHGIAEQEYMPTECLAEAVILKAEKIARGGTTTDTQIEVDQKKHRALVEGLTQRLNQLPVEKFSDPGKIVTQLSTAMSAGKTGGVQQASKPIIGKANPNKVSLDKKAAQRVWLQKLKTI